MAWSCETCSRNNSFNLLLSSKYISFQSQLITETVASGGDRFGKLFELMDQVCYFNKWTDPCYFFLEQRWANYCPGRGVLSELSAGQKSSVHSDNILSISDLECPLLPRQSDLRKVPYPRTDFWSSICIFNIFSWIWLID